MYIKNNSNSPFFEQQVSYLVAFLVTSPMPTLRN